MAHLNLVHFSSIVLEEYDTRHVTTEDMKNETISRKLLQIEKECKKRCPRRACHAHYTITKLIVNHLEDFHGINVELPQDPFISVKHRPSLLFAEFLVYIMSCFGTWFGLSVYALNPLLIARKRHTGTKRKLRERNVSRNSREKTLEEQLRSHQRALNSIEVFFAARGIKLRNCS